MFGYVTVCREMMNEADYEIFRSYYCGVCRATGNMTSQTARLGLSYDITFLAIVLSSVTEKENTIKSGICAAHPMKKREYVCNDSAVDYAACMGTLLTYLKFLDDVHDEKSPKAAAMALMFFRGAKKARKKYPEQYTSIAEQLRRLSVLEKENCAEIDECADCFAEILEALFTPKFVTDSKTKRILAWFGYNLGRWIYIIDAYNDMEKDMKNKSYNPFLAMGFADFNAHRKKIKEQLKISLTFTLENIAASFELLKTHKNRSVIEHIAYQGLRAKQAGILGENDESLCSIGSESRR